jgi:hypothetical protein
MAPGAFGIPNPLTCFNRATWKWCSSNPKLGRGWGIGCKNVECGIFNLGFDWRTVAPDLSNRNIWCCGPCPTCMKYQKIDKMDFDLINKPICPIDNHQINYVYLHEGVWHCGVHPLPDYCGLELIAKTTTGQSTLAKLILFVTTKWMRNLCVHY